MRFLQIPIGGFPGEKLSALMMLKNKIVAVDFLYSIFYPRVLSITDIRAL
jgi:hypothetical protein